MRNALEDMPKETFNSEGVKKLIKKEHEGVTDV